MNNGGNGGDIKIISAGGFLELYEHHNIHTAELLKQYPDLTICEDYQTLNLNYYSNAIASEVDEVEFTKEVPSTYVALHTAFPFKNVKISCRKCHDPIRINSSPNKIPLVMEHETSFRTNRILYSLLYEEYLKDHLFNTKIAGLINMYIVNLLKDPQYKTETKYLGNSVKKLISFI